MKKILIYHPDIHIHKQCSQYSQVMYGLCEELYTVKSLEWYFKNFRDKEIKWLYLNWYENCFKNYGYYIQKIQYSVKYAILQLAKSRNHKIAMVFHNKAPHNMKTDSREYQFVYKPFMRKYLRISDRIVVVSRHSEEFLKREFNLGEEDLSSKVVYVPIGLGKVYPCNKHETRQKYKLEDFELVYSYVGRMDEYKNIDVIIKAFKESNVKGKLLLVGKASSDYSEKLINLIGSDENIVFKNTYLSEEEMSKIIQAVDVLVLPYENTSMNSGTIIYAFSNATTVICTNIEMLQDYPRELCYGYQHNNKQENEKSLVAQLQIVNRDFQTGMLKKKGIQLQNIVMKENNWENVKLSLTKVFESY